MAPPRKHVEKARKLWNTIEEQTVPNEEHVIVIYATLLFQGMSWEVHFEFAYGNIRTHPYFRMESKDGCFFVNLFCCNTWMFLIKFFSHNKKLSWFLVHNTFILFYLGLWFSVIPSYYWHCGGWFRCNSPLCMLIQCNTLINCTRFCTSKGSSSNSRWTWRCNGW
jgi:hypothetical protein